MWFWFALYWWLVMWSTFSYDYWPSVCLFSKKKLFPLPSILWIIWFLVAFYEFFKMYFDCMPLIKYMVCVFSHLIGWLFILLIVYFVAQKLLSLIHSWLLFFAFVFCTFSVISKKTIIKTNVETFLMFSFRTFMVLSLRVKFLIHLSLILGSGLR